MTHSSPPVLKMSLDQALFTGSQRQLEGMVVVIYENERPLAGTAGWLDWRFRGALSSFVKSGFITGKEGECAYLPITHQNQIFHLILIGAGVNTAPGQRPRLAPQCLQGLKQNLSALKIQKIGIIENEFQSLSTDLKGVPLWIVSTQ